MYSVHNINVLRPMSNTNKITKIIAVQQRLLNIFTLLTIIACVVGREPIRPLDDVKIILQNAEAGGEILGIPTVDDGPPCTIDLQMDLPKPSLPQPLYIKPGTTEWWLPNENGVVEVPRGQSIELHCTNSFANVTDQDGFTGNTLPYKSRTIHPSCLQGTTFTFGGDKYEFRHFTCTAHAKYTAERTTKRCANNMGQLYRIGYNLTSEHFLETMQICHNEAEVRTYYVRHRMNASNMHTQWRVKRLDFSKAGHFGALNMNSLYTKNNQYLQAALLLGNQDEAMSYIVDNTYFLTRGHLAAKADMIYATQQRTTFTFLNAAPQWNSFNAGQWERLEYQVRAFVAKERLDVICYTGTWGIMQLNAVNSSRRAAFYLTADENNNGLLPVPALYYRVVVVVGANGVDYENPSKGIALVGVNNPHATLLEILNEYVVCQDIREEVPWLSWMQNRQDNLKKGYMYACHVEEFVKATTSLPPHLGNITELLV